LKGLTDPASGFVTIHDRQGDVHQDQVGMMFPRHADSLLTIPCDDQVVIIFQ